MIDKKEFLLQSIIKAYIEHLEPIASSQLKSMYDISYSPATIRGYFKKLGDEGFLAQEHISSGRIPTIEALKQYWTNKLNFKLSLVDLKVIEALSSKMGITALVKYSTNDKLLNIINVENKYMILEFDTFPITVKFSSALFRFLQDMIGLEINHILKISKEVGAYEIYQELSRYIQNKDFEVNNSRDFMRMALEYNMDEISINKFLGTTIIDNCEEGIYFEQILPSGYIAICHNCNIKGREAKLLVIGELSKDYEYFYNQISMI